MTTPHEQMMTILARLDEAGDGTTWTAESHPSGRPAWSTSVHGGGSGDVRIDIVADRHVVRVTAAETLDPDVDLHAQFSIDRPHGGGTVPVALIKSIKNEAAGDDPRGVIARLYNRALTQTAGEALDAAAENLATDGRNDR